MTRLRTLVLEVDKINNRGQKSRTIMQSHKLCHLPVPPIIVIESKE